MLAMLFSVSMYAKPEFQEFRDTAENGIIISISNPRYDYEMEYYPEYDYYWAKGEFSLQIMVNKPVSDIHLRKGFPSPSLDNPDIIYFSGHTLFWDFPINEPFIISYATSPGRYMRIGYCVNYIHDDYDLDLVFSIDDFISDEDKEKLYGSVDDVQAVDNNAPVVAKRNGKLVIDWNGTESCGSTVSIFNLNGIRQYARSVAESSQETEIPMESIPQGICIVHIQTEKRHTPKKIKL